jgi:hypothetical protein
MFSKSEYSFSRSNQLVFDVATAAGGCFACKDHDFYSITNLRRRLLVYLSVLHNQGMAFRKAFTGGRS